MIDIDEALALLRDAVPAPLAAERAVLGDAVGRVVAEDVRAAVDLPGFDRSSMDGWAVRAADLPGALPVVGDVAAGEAGDAPLRAGTALRISTGAPMPPGADAVLRLEAGRQDDGHVATDVTLAPGTFVRRRGEDVRRGEVVLAAGARLAPARLAVVASAGVGEVAVVRRPRVAVVVTGSELTPLGEPLRPGAIYDSNGPVLAEHARADGALPLAPVAVPDDPAVTREVLARTLEEADVVLVSGGVSVGPHDHVKPALADLGVEELFWRVRLKPGKPILAGRRGAALVFGLPGNPLSTVVGHLVFVGPVLRRLGGAPFAPTPTRPVPLGADVTTDGERTTYATARLDAQGRAVLTERQGSHMTKALADADGFAVLPAERHVFAAGELVEFLALDP